MDLQPPNNTFSPPSPEQVETLLNRYALTEPSNWIKYGQTAFLFLALISIFALDQGLAGLFFILPMSVVFGLSYYRQQQRKRKESEVRQLTTMCQLRDSPFVLRASWRLLPQLIHSVDLYARVILLMAQSLQHVKAHEASLVAYDWLDRTMPAESEIGIFIRLQRCALLLMTDHLSDADLEIRKLKAQIESTSNANGVLQPLLVLTEMLQLLKTNNYRQLLAYQSNAITQLRPLGVQAAVGYALLALAAYELSAVQQGDSDVESAQDDEHAKAMQQEKLLGYARTWWTRATLLMPAERLCWHLPELERMKLEPSITAHPEPDLGTAEHVVRSTALHQAVLEVDPGLGLSQKEPD